MLSCDSFFFSSFYDHYLISDSLICEIVGFAWCVEVCLSNPGLRTFHASATRLLNRPDDKLKNMTNDSNFKNICSRDS